MLVQEEAKTKEEPKNPAQYPFPQADRVDTDTECKRNFIS